MSAESGTAEDTPERAGLGLSGSPTWALFCDWCVATERSALPAAASTLARFLDAHPAPASTQRRRVADIDTVHRRSGLAEPGHTVAIRLAVDERRRDRAALVRAAAETIIESIPTHGWPSGLFGRRDAMILTLIASGMTSTEITALQRGDIAVDNSDLVVSGEHRIAGTLFGDRPAYEPVAIHRRWAELQSLLDGAATSRMVADALDPNRTPAPNSSAPVYQLPAAYASEPLLVRIDRWGHTPWAPEPLSSRSAGTLTRAHLTGQPPTRRDRTAQPESGSGPDPVAPHDLVLDPSYYAHGIAARRDAHDRLSDMGGQLDDIDNSIDALLRRLDDIVGNAEAS
ncbi:hypothetical protein ACTHQY_04635 [Rhodococcoides corynebacterioides]|uniref:hypothetical protein n=1 Tax=Rhodococcoides corynebacterioides TaxID=53972 RepID=UPI003F7E6995